MNLENALQRYGDFKAGRAVPWLLKPYLEMLDEGDHVGAYLIGVLGRREEYRILKQFVNGKPVAELVAGKNGGGQGEAREWIENFIDEMVYRFLGLSWHCPFCDASRGGGGKTNSPYPLSSKSCPHREIDGEES